MKQHQIENEASTSMTRKQFLVAAGMLVGSAALASFFGKSILGRSPLAKGQKDYGNGSYGGRA